ncbi:MAG: hypothetical protein WHS63_11240 [Tenuifilum sp.]|uniref:hypothetical protein n=2 Tax=Tenuifilum sp. TaxID=2760880 RepID=UPI0030A2BA05
METISNCPKLEKCPIYLKNVFFNPNAGETYRKIYCTAGKEKYTSCKRYLVSEKVGKPVPESVMPNCSLTVDEIIAKYNLSLLSD